MNIPQTHRSIQSMRFGSARQALPQKLIKDAQLSKQENPAARLSDHPVLGWVQMSLRLIKEGRAEKKLEKKLEKKQRRATL